MIPVEENYETYNQELLAIVASFKQWRHYVEGSQFPIEVLTDHNNLRGFMNVKQLTPRQSRWAVALSAVDFVISHRAGKTNPADGPSRRPDYEGDSPSMTTLLPTLQNKLKLSSRARTLVVGQERRQALSAWCHRISKSGLTDPLVGTLRGPIESSAFHVGASSDYLGLTPLCAVSR